MSGGADAGFGLHGKGPNGTLCGLPVGGRHDAPVVVAVVGQVVTCDDCRSVIDHVRHGFTWSATAGAYVANRRRS